MRRGSGRAGGRRHVHERGWAVLSGSDGVVVARSRSPMVGRRRELQFVVDRLEAADEGRPRGVVVVGAAGIGKSRLGREVRSRARETGFQVVTADGPHDTGVPFWAVARHLVPLLFDAFAGDAAYRGDLAVLRELDGSPSSTRADGTRTGGGPGATPPGSVRRVAYEGGPPRPQDEAAQRLLTLTRLTIEMAQRHPLLLMVEDVHDADPATVLFLDQLLVTAARVAAHEAVPLLVLALSRPGADEHGGADRLARLPDVELLRLEGFDRREALDLLGSLGIEPDTPAAEAVVAASDGSPLFLESASRLLFAGGDDSSSLKDLSLPTSLHDAVGRDLELLDPDVRSLLADVALVGERVDLGHLAALVGTGPEQLAERLRPAQEAGILESEQDTVRFTHALRRLAAASLRDGQEQRRRHLELADRIEELATESGGGPDELAIAHHLIEAGSTATPDRVERWAGEAARRSEAARSWHEAGRLYEAASEACERQGAETSLRRGRLLLGAARSWFGALEMSRAAATATRAAEALADGHDPGAHAEAVVLHYRCEVFQGRFSAAVAPGPDLDALQHDERVAVALRVEARIIASELAWMSENTAEAARLADAAHAQAHEEQLHALASAALVSRATVAWLNLELRASVGLLDEARRVADKGGDDLGVTIATGRCAFTHWLLGHGGHAVALAREALARADERGHELERSMPLAVFTCVAVAEGDHAAVDIRSGDALLLQRTSGDWWTAPFVAGPLIYRAALMGETPESIDPLLDLLSEGMAGEVGRGVSSFLRLWVRAVSGTASPGDEDILSSLDRPGAGEIFPTNSVGVPALCASWVDAVDLTGVARIPEVVLHRLVEADRQGQRIGSTFPVVLARSLATAARLRGDLDIAEREARRALAEATSLGLGLEQARAHHELARTLVRGDRAQEAARHVEAFVEGCRRLRLHGLMALAARAGDLPSPLTSDGAPLSATGDRTPVVVVVVPRGGSAEARGHSAVLQVQRRCLRSAANQATELGGVVVDESTDRLHARFPTLRVAAEFALRTAARAQRSGARIGLGIEAVAGEVTSHRAEQVAGALGEMALAGEVLVTQRAVDGLETAGVDAQPHGSALSLPADEPLPVARLGVARARRVAGDLPSVGSDGHLPAVPADPEGLTNDGDEPIEAVPSTPSPDGSGGLTV